MGSLKKLVNKSCSRVFQMEVIGGGRSNALFCHCCIFATF